MKASSKCLIQVAFEDNLKGLDESLNQIGAHGAKEGMLEFFPRYRGNERNLAGYERLKDVNTGLPLYRG
jgi:hypothetical protein